MVKLVFLAALGALSIVACAAGAPSEPSGTGSADIVTEPCGPGVTVATDLGGTWSVDTAAVDAFLAHDPSHVLVTTFTLSDIDAKKKTATLVATTRQTDGHGGATDGPTYTLALSSFGRTSCEGSMFEYVIETSPIGAPSATISENATTSLLAAGSYVVLYDNPTGLQIGNHQARPVGAFARPWAEAVHDAGTD